MGRVVYLVIARGHVDVGMYGITTSLGRAVDNKNGYNQYAAWPARANEAMLALVSL